MEDTIRNYYHYDQPIDTIWKTYTEQGMLKDFLYIQYGYGAIRDIYDNNLDQVGAILVLQFSNVIIDF